MQLRDVISSRLLRLVDDGRAGRADRDGDDGLDRPVHRTVTIDLPDPRRFVSPGDLVLTGLIWLRQDPERPDAYVRILVEAGAAALGAGEAEFGHVPSALEEACTRHGLPLLAIGVNVSFTSIAEFVARRQAGARVGNLAALVDRHRRLTTAGGTGGGAEALLELLWSELDLRAHLVSPTGRLVAGTRPALPEETATALAARFLTAERSRRRPPHRTRVHTTAYSLFPVRSGPGAGAAPTDWLVAVEADSGDWPGEHIDLVERLAALMAVERAGRHADRAPGRRAAGRLLGPLESPAGGGVAAPSEAAARLATTLTGADGPGDGVRWQPVAARWETLTGGAPVADLLEEVLLHPRCLGPDAAHRIAVTATGDAGEAVAFVLLARGEELTSEAVRHVAGAALPLALRDGERLSLGLGDPVEDAADLRHAVAEARHARQVAAAPRTAGTGPASSVGVCGPADMASHVMSLLPLIPAEVRRAFSRRLLSPLYEYDRRHHSDLVPTLRSFLDHDGSWARCGESLHLHVNSLRYRISRIESLTGRNLARLEDKMDFVAALRMH
ncbi:PucR family transcriptional regulator ligand-binding domain-containing protein [Streptomyces sp. NPDC048383]|uniref:PucR family transcriptional regulator ligand-binding domain-containing protein n=1 Tax=Streptomyces sp. NPDC048383 TaxID=3155386 RepID=UPI0034396AD2